MLASLQLCLAPLGCSLGCLPVCLLDSLINSLFNGFEEFEIFTYTVFQELYYFLVFVPIFCLGTIFPYGVIRQLISDVLSLDVLTLTILSLDT